MSFSIQDPQTEAAVRRLAERLNTSLTEAIRIATENEFERSHADRSLFDRLKAIGDLYGTFPKTGKRADKSFFDDLDEA